MGICTYNRGSDTQSHIIQEHFHNSVKRSRVYEDGMHEVLYSLTKEKPTVQLQCLRFFFVVVFGSIWCACTIIEQENVLEC